MEKSKNLTESLDTESIEKKLMHFFNCAIKSDYPVAIWCNPNQEGVQAICQLSKTNLAIDELENCPEGFLFSPFKKDKARKFIKADVLLNQKSSDLEQNTTYVGTQEVFDTFLAKYKSMPDDRDFRVKDYVHQFDGKVEDKAHYIQLVENCKSLIASGRHQKIVPSRRNKLKLSDEFHPVTELFKLSAKYENAFVSLVAVPDEGIWLGASPELLLSLQSNQYFKTIALAGTQQIPDSYDLAKAAWTQKEIEEQALVSRYIINCFKQIRLREFDEYGPKTVKAGNLMHLKTTFSVDMKDVNFPQLGTVMLDLMHPTSAVCGMPMLPSARFLEENEGYDRAFYSGYLGPVNVQGKTSLYVNLRCMQVYKNVGILYAGAGVTEGSDPESEWIETEMKFETLRHVIGK